MFLQFGKIRRFIGISYRGLGFCIGVMQGVYGVFFSHNTAPGIEGTLKKG